MRHDKSLAIAVAATIGYTIAVGALSSKPASLSVAATRPVAMYATFVEAHRMLRIEDPEHIEVIAQWLDDAMANPRSAFDLRILPPPINELDIEFESGEHTTVYFSGRTLRDRKMDAERRAKYPNPIYVVQHDGAMFTIDGVPDVLAGYLELTENPPETPVQYPQPYKVKPDR